MSKKLEITKLHGLPKDISGAIQKGLIKPIWSTLTPLQRNEWICWVISVKKKETREQHIERLVSDIQKGKKRPCCFPGCPHRK